MENNSQTQEQIEILRGCIDDAYTAIVNKGGTAPLRLTAANLYDAITNIPVPTKTSDLINDSGFISTVPTASASTIGGVKIDGNNLSINSNGILSAVDTTYTASDFDIKDLSDSTSLRTTWSGKLDTLTAGTNIQISGTTISATDTTYTASDFDIKDLTDSTDLRTTWSGKQDTLTAGTNVQINGTTISATDTTYTASDFDIKDLTDSTSLMSAWSGKLDALTAGDNITITGTTITAVDRTPIGAILMWPTSTPPTGWLLCNGQSIETGDQYAALRTVLGANEVPNLTGKFPLGVNSTYTLGSTGGEETHTLDISEMPSHSHTISKGYHYGGSSELSPTVTLNTYNLNSRNVRQATADALTPEDLNPINYVDLNGSGLAHNNMPPYYAINFIIKYQ